MGRGVEGFDVAMRALDDLVRDLHPLGSQILPLHRGLLPTKEL